MRDQKKAEEIAVQRMQLLSPLLAEDLDAARARQLKTQICEQSCISERTLRRYLAQYWKEGFAGLKPKGKGEGNLKEAIPAHVSEQAILLRREVPKRSVSQIIQILEWEGLVEPGQIKRSTLQEKLAQKGYSNRHRFPALSALLPQPALAFGYQVRAISAYWSGRCKKAGLPGNLHR